MHVDYSNVTVSHAIGNNLHKQQHVNTMHFVKKLFTLYVCLQALMNVGYMHTPYKLFDCSWTSYDCSWTS